MGDSQQESECRPKFFTALHFCRKLRQTYIYACLPNAALDGFSFQAAHENVSLYFYKAANGCRKSERSASPRLFYTRRILFQLPAGRTRISARKCARHVKRREKLIVTRKFA